MKRKLKSYIKQWILLTRFLSLTDKKKGQGLKILTPDQMLS